MNQVQEPGSGERTPRPFGELVKLWMKFTKMTEAFFQEELGRVSVSNTLYSILIVAVFTAALSIVSSAISSSIPSTPPPSVDITQFMAIGKILLPICGLITMPVSFFLNIGITYLGALIFGGKGNFKSQAYLVSLYYVPLSIISGCTGFLTWIPVLGLPLLILVSLGISIFHVILTIRVFKVVHLLSTGKAVAAVLSPLILILIPLCLISILALLGPAIGNVFSGIISGLGTPVP
jgi:hypothetical protein